MKAAEGSPTSISKGGRPRKAIADLKDPYRALHQRKTAEAGQASLYECSCGCGAQAQDWALVPPEQMIGDLICVRDFSGRARWTSTSTADLRAMSRACHLAADRALRAERLG